MNEVILKAENVHTGRMAELIDVDVFFGERGGPIVEFGAWVYFFPT